MKGFLAESTANIIETYQYEKNIDKIWGKETILVANSEYTVKKMILYPGYKCSDHLHRKKKESFILLEGQLDITCTNTKTTKKTIVSLNEKYDTLTLKEMTIHSFSCKLGQKDPTIFLECSTEDLPEDSYRFTQSCSQDK